MPKLERSSSIQNSPTPPPIWWNFVHILTVAVVAVLVSVLALGVYYYFDSGYLCPVSQGCAHISPYTISFGESSGVVIESLSPHWGGGLPCSNTTQCKAINFTSIQASSALTTQMFGLAISLMNGTKASSLRWVIVLWSSNERTPIAGFNGTTSAWTPAAGQSLPIGNLSGDYFMLIYLGPSLIGSGDSVVAFSTGGIAVTGGSVL